MSESQGTLLEALDQGPLDRRYWGFFGVASLSSTIDFFDFFIAGFLLSVVAPLWDLTYGQTALIFLAAGVGSILGSIAGGHFCDRYGRRPVIIFGSALCAAFSASLSIVPDGAWILFATLRCLTGCCVSAVFAGIIAVTVERTPTRHRTVVSSLAFVSPSIGVLMAAVSSAFLLETLGWRGLALMGALPIVPGVLAIFLIPESVSWLVSVGRFREARNLARRQLGPIAEILEIDESMNGRRERIGFRDLYEYKRSFWLVVLIWFGMVTGVYGIYAWGPTIVMFTQSVSPQEAARLFVVVSAAGVTGKVVFSFLSGWLGRRRTGQLTSAIAAAALAVAAVVPASGLDVSLYGLPIFLLVLALCTLTAEGCGAGMSPYSAEVFPVMLAARGAGLGQAAAGIGKIVGPTSLGLIAGTGNLVSPAATLEAVLPGFLFLSACFGIAFAAFTFLGIETHGRQLSVVFTKCDDANDCIARRKKHSRAQAS